MASSKTKVLILFPPLDTTKGCPTLGGNRQFQYFKVPTYIYPLVPAQLATQLKREGHSVQWVDCIADKTQDIDYWIKHYKPDVVYMETKTPVHLEIMRWKYELQKVWRNAEIIVFGDHASYLGIDPINYNKLGFDIDRDLTKWWLYAYENGNYKRTPGTYIMSARDCWWGMCTFCSWVQMYPNYNKREPKEVADEIDSLVNQYGVREIMDDSGTFPTGSWLIEFCEEMISRGLNRKVNLNCNMRFGVLTRSDYKLMKRAGFRMLLYGLESANQYTLDRLNKGIDVFGVVPELKTAKKCGLYPHVTVMFGYPWETKSEALNTVALMVGLIKSGLAYTAQATLVVPYPGTPLYKEAYDKGWIQTVHWGDYDMSQPVMSCDYDPKEMIGLVYKAIRSPSSILKKIASIRDMDEILYLIRGFTKVKGHIANAKG